MRFWEISWGCFLAKPLEIGTLNMELFFSVRIRRKKWDMSKQNPWDLIFSSILTWENAALLDGCDKIILSPRYWETDLSWASDISRCAAILNLSFWLHVRKADRLYTAALNPHLSALQLFWFWLSPKLGWGCFLAKPLQIGTLNMELFFSVRIRRKKWDMSEQNPWDLIFSSTLTWENAALLDGCVKIILSPRNWDLSWASDI